MKIKDIKKEFPIFNQKIKGKPLIYLDSANSSQKPKVVIDEISRFYETEFSNVGRSVHTLAVKATNKFEETSKRLSLFNKTLPLERSTSSVSQIIIQLLFLARDTSHPA